MARNASPTPPGSRQRDWARTAATLAEALPHIQAHEGRIVVIKLGGATIDDEGALARFALDVTLLRQCGVRPIVVHGGGPQIGAMLDQFGIQSEFVGGHRVTDARSIEIVEMVLAGTVNKQVVSAIHKQGGRAVGLSGKDGGLMRAERRLGADGSDLGFVGTPAKVDARVLDGFLESDFIPVIAPVAWSKDSATYNINADTAAGAVAAEMRAARLLLLTDVGGVLGPDGEIIPELTTDAAEALIDDGTIAKGMIPKVRTAGDAVAAGVEATVILDGRTPHATLLELFTDYGAGTLIAAGELR